MELFAKTDKNSDMFELDVWLTNDDKPQIVVHHDKSTIRISGKDMIVSETKFADLPCFKDEYQTYGGPILKTNNEKICLL